MTGNDQTTESTASGDSNARDRISLYIPIGDNEIETEAQTDINPSDVSPIYPSWITDGTDNDPLFIKSHPGHFLARKITALNSEIEQKIRDEVSENGGTDQNTPLFDARFFHQHPLSFHRFKYPANILTPSTSDESATLSSEETDQYAYSQTVQLVDSEQRGDLNVRLQRQLHNLGFEGEMALAEFKLSQGNEAMSDDEAKTILERYHRDPTQMA